MNVIRKSEEWFVANKFLRETFYIPVTTLNGILKNKDVIKADNKGYEIH